MAAALPLVKLGFLLVRTIAKPFAGRLKDYLKDHDTARSAFSRLGQMLHKVEVRVAGNDQYLKVDKKGKSGIFEAKVKPLDEGKAVANGADFFAESIIFIIAGICLTIEVKSSNKKDEQKKAALEKRFFDAEESIRKYKIQIQSLTQELQLARQHVISLHRDAVGLMQARPFTQDEVEEAEARLETWISSFKDEASRRDSLLQLQPAPKPLVEGSSFFEEFTSLFGLQNDDKKSHTKVRRPDDSSLDVPNDAGETDIEIALKKLEANRKESLSLRKAKSKHRIDDAKVHGSSPTMPVTQEGKNFPLSAQAVPSEPLIAATLPSSDSRVDWRKVTFSSIVLGIAITYATLGRSS